MPWISVAKLGFVIFIIFTLNSYWRHCGGAGGGAGVDIVESCSSSAPGDCYAYCGDTVDTLITINDDMSLQHLTTTGYCTASFSGECACTYWQTFMLVPTLLHALQLVLVLATRSYKVDPQQLHYNIMYKHLQGSAPALRPMLEELFQQPYYCVFSFFEIGTFVYVWLELVYAPVRCGEGIMLSELYFPLVMTVVDFSKFNVYLCVQHAKQYQWEAAAAALFNLYYLVLYSVVTSCLGILYGVTVIHSVVTCCWHCWCWCCGVGLNKAGAGLYDSLISEEGKHQSAGPTDVHVHVHVNSVVVAAADEDEVTAGCDGGIGMDMDRDTGSVDKECNLNSQTDPLISPDDVQL